MTIHQDVRVYAGLFDGEERAKLAVVPGRRAYVHVARGAIDVDGEHLVAGDAAMVTESDRITLSGGRNAEVLAFDLP